jgi:hypothetical protein
MLTKFLHMIVLFSDMQLTKKMVYTSSRNPQLMKLFVYEMTLQFRCLLLSSGGDLKILIVSRQKKNGMKMNVHE